MIKYFFLLFISVFFGTVFSYELSIAAIFQNEAPYFEEWIEYHRMVGVEHFWLFNDASTDYWKEVLQPYIDEGVVEVIQAPPRRKHGFIELQNHMYNEALKKAKGTTKWLALIDIDEFLLPMQDKTVTECLRNHYSDAAGIYVCWRMFGTGNVTLKKDERLLFRLSAVSKRSQPDNSVGKSIVRPDHVLADLCWYPHHFVIEQGSKYYDGDGNVMIHDGHDLITDAMPHDKYIRINHYNMRDENFFHNVRMARARENQISEKLIWEHYHEFNEERDFSIMNFIKKNHPKMYQSFWKTKKSN